MAHIRKSRPGAGLGFHVKVLETFLFGLSLLGSRVQEVALHGSGVLHRAGPILVGTPNSQTASSLSQLHLTFTT